MVSRPYWITHSELTGRARANPPKNPTNTVSSFCDWIFGLYAASRQDSLDRGKAAEFEAEREFRQSWRQNLPRDCELLFCDPLDGRGDALEIKVLSFNNRPLRAIPDLVFRHKSTGKVDIIERKWTKSAPAEWPNLKAQLWCYAQIDAWRNAPEIEMRGLVMKGPGSVLGPWSRNDARFDLECSELFEIFGGKRLR